MKKIFISMLLLANLTSYAKPLLHEFNEANPHRIYLGPELFLFDLKTSVDKVEVRGEKCFLGLRLGYEYLRPEFFYAGIDILCSGSDKAFPASLGNRHMQNNAITGFANIDLRLGYTFASLRGLWTSFLGIGSYAFGNSDSKGSRFGFNENISYCEGGLRSRYEISNHFNIGLNAKLIHTNNRRNRFDYPEIHASHHKNVWGSEIGLPLTWIFHGRAWDVQLEPYVLNFYTRNTQNIYGTRLLLGYRF